MADAKRFQRPETGEVFSLRTHTAVMVGPKELNPRDYAEHGTQWTILIDDERNCVWIGWQGEWWSRVEWGNIQYVRYCKANGQRPGETVEQMQERQKRAAEAKSAA